MIIRIINWFKGLYNGFLSLFFINQKVEESGPDKSNTLESGKNNHTETSVSEQRSEVKKELGETSVLIQKAPLHDGFFQSKKSSVSIKNASVKALERLCGNRLTRILMKEPTLDPYEPSEQVSLFVNEKIRGKIRDFIQKLKPYQALFLPAVREHLESDDVDAFIQYIYQSKLSKSFAEMAKFTGGQINDRGHTWSQDIFEILQGIHTIAEVDSYHNGAFGNPLNGVIFTEPKPITLVAVAGVCFEGEAGKNSCVYKALVKNGKLDMKAYVDELKSRLLPLFQHFDQSANGGGLLIKVPGISCGFFGGPFRGGHTQVGMYYALQQILEENTFSNIKGVVYDVYEKDKLFKFIDKKENHGRMVKDIGSTRYIAYESERYNNGKDRTKQIQINTDAEVYDETFKGLKEVALVAADALSLLGNDMYVGSYRTNEGVWAGTTDVIMKILSCGGFLDKFKVVMPLPDRRKHFDCFLAPRVLPGCQPTFGSKLAV